MIGFYYGKNDGKTLLAGRKLAEEFYKRGVEYVEKTENELFDGCFSGAELVVVFGGDGSVLKAVRAAEGKIPVIGVNTGNLGFLTSYSESCAQKIVDDYLNGSLEFSERSLIEVSFSDKKTLCLNDAVIAKDYVADRTGGCVRLSLFIDGAFVDDYVADGLIIGTPTGSTAYALSAGGPVITPKLDAFEAVPISAHSLHARPVVYPTASVATVKVEGNKACALYADGEYAGTLKKGELATFKKSELSAKILISDDEFFSKLNKKLNYWSTTRGEDNE